MVAWDKAGDPDYHPELGKPWAPLKLYYTHGFIRQRLQMFHDLLIEEGKTSPYAEILERWKPHQADIMARVTTQVPCAEYFDVRDDVLRAHATQIDPAGTFFARLLTYNRSCGQPKNSNLRPPGFGPRFRRMTCSPGFRRTATTTSRTPC